MYSKWKQNLPLGFNILCSVNVCISSVAWTAKAECSSLARAVHIWKENFTNFCTLFCMWIFYYFQLSIGGWKWSLHVSEAVHKWKMPTLTFLRGFSQALFIWSQCSEIQMLSTNIFLNMPGMLCLYSTGLN